MSSVKCMTFVVFAAFALTITPSSHVRAQSIEDECAKVAAAAPYAQQKKAYDKCMAEKGKKKG
jgi:hypothetical protein